MVVALVVAGAVGAGFAAYHQGVSPFATIGFTLAGGVFGYLLSRFRHWVEL